MLNIFSTNVFFLVFMIQSSLSQLAASCSLWFLGEKDSTYVIDKVKTLNYEINHR